MTAALAVLVVAGVFAAVASAAAPQNTALPAISGTAKEGSTLTASTGTWSNGPTSFAGQWQRPVAGDVSHTLRVVVTATNADGKTSASSDPTDVVASKNGPSNTVKLTVTGSPVVGEHRAEIVVALASLEQPPATRPCEERIQRCLVAR